MPLQSNLAWSPPPRSSAFSRRSPSTVDFFHANVTAWGPKAEGYLLAHPVDVIMISETHTCTSTGRQKLQAA